MIKDGIFKAWCIPLLGVLIPLAARLIHYWQHSTVVVLLSNLYFILVSFSIWQGSVWIIAHARNFRWLYRRFFEKMLLLCGLTAAYSFLTALCTALLWQQVVLQHTAWTPALRCGVIAGALVIFLTVLYEAMFLSKERELDVKIVDQLDKERVQAEITALKSELDPHFIFNSLTTLSHLISVEPEKAQAFTHKLALVYKYILINKDRELISLEDELKFVEDYFFLLQIRYDDNVKLRFNLRNVKEKIMVLPCSLQLLVENAIKHNRFTAEEPLLITVSLNGEYLRVSNNVRSKLYAVESTRIGLNHLNAHYKLMCNKDIVVENGDKVFAVAIPLIKTN